MTYDLAVIGSGSAAFAAAIRARELGREVLLIERGTTGGTCVNVGCIPSKALIAAANSRFQSRRNAFSGVETTAGDTNLGELLAGVSDIVGALQASKYRDVAKRHGFEIRAGSASFASADTLLVDGDPIEARAYLIATGASPMIPTIDGLRDAGYVTSTTLLELDELPRSLVVLGGGYIGLEYAQAFSRLGSEVTLIARSGIVRNEEPPIASALEGYLSDEGITILQSANVTRVERRADTRRVHVRLDDGEIYVDADVLLVATGRTANIEGLELDTASVAITDRGTVLVDQQLRTTNPRVWAAGDCCDVPQFVYVAAQMGAVAAANALDDAAQTIDWSALPRITFTDPTLAAVGLTEAQAHAQGIDCRCHTIDITYASRPWVQRDLRGAIRIVATRDTEQVIGVSVLAPHGEDVILAAQLAVRHKLTLSDLQNAWTPYLSLGEAVKIAAVSFDRDPSLLSCCA